MFEKAMTKEMYAEMINYYDVCTLRFLRAKRRSFRRQVVGAMLTWLKHKGFTADYQTVELWACGE